SGKRASGALQPPLDVVGRDAHLDAHARLGQLGDLGPHGRPSLPIPDFQTAAPRSAKKARTLPTGPVTSHASTRSAVTTPSGALRAGPPDPRRRRARHGPRRGAPPAPRRGPSAAA